MKSIEKAHGFEVWDLSILDVLEVMIFCFEGIHVLAY